MSSSYQNKKKPIKKFVVQINSFIVDILINGFFVVITFVDTDRVAASERKSVGSSSVSHRRMQFLPIVPIRFDHPTDYVRA